MSILDSLQHSLCPRSYAKKQVEGMLDELHDRPVQGDKTLYTKLDELNARTGALAAEPLTDAYLEGSHKDFAGGEQSTIRDAIAKRQTGFGAELAGTAFADGAVSADERKAIEDIADQHYTSSGNCGDLPRLAYGEAADLKEFAGAPSDEIRGWMLKHAGDGSVGLPAARELGEIVLADHHLSAPEGEFLLHSQGAFGARLESTASTFLRGLGCTELRPGNDKDGPSLLDTARSEDDVDDAPEGPGPHEQALREAVAFTIAHTQGGGVPGGAAKPPLCQGMSDSGAARSLFPAR